MLAISSSFVFCVSLFNKVAMPFMHFGGNGHHIINREHFTGQQLVLPLEFLHLAIDLFFLNSLSVLLLLDGDYLL